MLPRGIRHGRFDRCTGYFCSFNCAKRYAIDQHCFYSFEMCSLLSSLYKCVIGRNKYERVHIIPSPPKCTLKAFGGHMTIEEYRRDFLILPPATEENRATRQTIVSVLSDNCVPSFSKAHIKHQTSVYNDVGVPQARQQRFERTTPVSRRSITEAMGIQVRSVPKERAGEE